MRPGASEKALCGYDLAGAIAPVSGSPLRSKTLFGRELAGVNAYGSRLDVARYPHMFSVGRGRKCVRRAFIFNIRVLFAICAGVWYNFWRRRGRHPFPAASSEKIIHHKGDPP